MERIKNLPIINWELLAMREFGLTCLHHMMPLLVLIIWHSPILATPANVGYLDAHESQQITSSLNIHNHYPHNSPHYWSCHNQHLHKIRALRIVWMGLNNIFVTVKYNAKGRNTKRLILYPGCIFWFHTQTDRQQTTHWGFQVSVPNSKVHGANIGPTWVLSAPDVPHVGPINLAIRVRLGASSTDRS